MNSFPGWRSTDGHVGQSVLVLGQEEEDLVLDRIGVLKLIHEDGLELALQPRPDMRVGLQQVAGAGQEAVEPDVARIEKAPPAPRGERFQQLEQVAEEGVIGFDHRLGGPDQTGRFRKLFLAPAGWRLRASLFLLQQRPKFRIHFSNAGRASAEHVAEQAVRGSQQRFDLTRLPPFVAGSRHELPGPLLLLLKPGAERRRELAADLVLERIEWNEVID